MHYPSIHAQHYRGKPLFELVKTLVIWGDIVKARIYAHAIKNRFYATCAWALIASVTNDNADILLARSTFNEMSEIDHTKSVLYPSLARSALVRMYVACNKILQCYELIDDIGWFEVYIQTLVAVACVTLDQNILERCAVKLTNYLSDERLEREYTALSIGTIRILLKQKKYDEARRFARIMLDDSHDSTDLFGAYMLITQRTLDIDDWNELVCIMRRLPHDTSRAKATKVKAFVDCALLFSDIH